MSAGDTGRTDYGSARLELIERMKLRDQALFLYLAAVGVLAGVALTKPTTAAEAVADAASKIHPEMLLLVPFLGLSAAIIASQHFLSMGYLAEYCVKDIGPFLQALQPNENAPQWEDSPILHDYERRALLWRSWGHVGIIIAPQIFALAFNWEQVGALEPTVGRLLVDLTSGSVTQIFAPVFNWSQIDALRFIVAPLFDIAPLFDLIPGWIQVSSRAYSATLPDGTAFMWAIGFYCIWVTIGMIWLTHLDRDRLAINRRWRPTPGALLPLPPAVIPVVIPVVVVPRGYVRTREDQRDYEQIRRAARASLAAQGQQAPGRRGDRPGRRGSRWGRTARTRSR